MTEYSHFSTYHDFIREKNEQDVPLNCGQCNYWYPDDLYPSLGQCQRKDAELSQKAVAEDNLSGPCFEERSLSSDIFCWCRKCRETIPVSEISLHAGHTLYVGTARYPVEEMAELTFAGD